MTESPVVNAQQPAAAAPEAPQQVPPGAAAGANVPLSSASLYVGDLHPDVTEAMLFELFNQVGQVASVRVNRDAVTRRSLGYAYVNFANMSDAERALDTMNFALIRGRPCRIMWSQRDPSLRRSNKGNIFVKNLDRTIDSKSLYDTFSVFGNILSCKVVVDSTGASRGYGFVHFETEEAATKAIEKVNGNMLKDKQVFVGPFVPREMRSGDKQNMFTNVYVKNLPKEVNDEKLHEMFKVFGAVTSAVVMTDGEGNSRGFGFVNFDDAEGAMTSVESLNGKEMDGNVLYVGRAQKKGERESELRRQFEERRQELLNKYQGVNLYVKNLDDAIDDEALRKEFEPFGTITSAKVMMAKDESGTARSRGFGFVCFSLPDEATKALTEMNGKKIGSKPIYVALAQRREERAMQLAAQHAQRMQNFRMPGGPGAPPVGAYPGAPMFYAPMPGQPPMPGMRQQNFMYPGQHMNPRMNARWAGNPQGRPFQAAAAGMPYVVPVVAQRNQVQGNRRTARQSTGKSPGGQQRNSKGQRQMQQGNARGAEHPEEQVQQGSDLSSQLLAAGSPDQQKMILGEHLYPLVANAQPELAGKITGMLLEMDNSEIILLVEDQNALHEKISEAIEVLQEHEQDAPKEQ